MVLHIIVLIFEVLYYSMFMKFARKEGKFWKYLLLFSLITIVLIFTGTGNLYVYLIFVLLSLYGLKYIVKTKISLFDILPIIIMLAIKIVIELLSMFIFYKFLYLNQVITTFIFEIIKILTILLSKNYLNLYYNKLKTTWDKNNFYIRYFFSIFAIIYVIISAISLIWLIMK